jgi:hypothetical protein
MTKRVLVTGARAPVALELARRFKRAGAEVFLADSIGVPGARFSFSVSGYFRLPPPIDDAAAFADALAGVVERERIDLVVPTCEEIYYVARFALRIGCPVFCDSFETLDRLHNKFTFSAVVRSSFAESPRTELVGDRALSAEELAGLVLKPVYSRFAASTLRSPSIEDFNRVRADRRRWLAQERVYGTEYSTYGVAHRGRLLAHACYHSEYRVDGGSGVLFRNVSREKTRILEFVRELVRAIDFTGQIGFDLIEAAGGRTFVLECNPRATSGMHLFAADDDLARAILEPDSIGETIVAGGPARKLAFALVFTEEVSRLDVARWPRLLADSLRTPDAVFAWNDPLPFAAAGLSLSEIILIAIRKRKKLTAAATHDIEFDGQPL